MSNVLDSFAFVNERNYEGRNYKAYRSINDPKECIVIIDNSVVMHTNTLKNYWLLSGANNN